MKKTILLFLIAFIFCGAETIAQSTRYIVRLRDKGTNPFSISNPSQYLTQRAIDRRARYSIPIDSADLPITPRYIDSIRLAGAVTILNSSKWLNQVAIRTTDPVALAKINSFPFVIIAAPIGSLVETPVNKKLDAPPTPATAGPEIIQNLNDYYNYGLSLGQVRIHNGEFLHNRGFRGQGMHMSVLDAGFLNYLTLPTFDSIRNNGQILGTWDFVVGNSSVNEDNSHGTQCLSTIAANMPGTFMGTAPKASFYLYRTEEVATEYPIEEQNWAAGAERADSLGVDVCSVSLGYYNFDNPAFNYTYNDMNGNTTIVARAADIAAKKGMMVVAAAGNEGNGAWHYIISPADADSVMAVGAVNTSGAVGGFSSYGPSSDGQVKPTLAAVGVGAVVANPSTGQPSFGNGTSFACPNLAGLTTCLWQAFPEVNNMTLLTAMQQSASRATNPDDRVGYGIPDMKKAFVRLIKLLYTQQFSVANCAATLQWTAKTDSVISVTVERKLPTDPGYTNINTQGNTGAFASRNYSYTDDLVSFTGGSVKYRFRMNIGIDTSFYLDSVTVNFTPKPALGADQAVSICENTSLNLTTIYNTTGLTVLWAYGGNPVANPSAVSAAGIYTLVATNNSGCRDTALVTLSYQAKPNLGADQSVTICVTGSFDLTTLYTTTGLTVSWTIGGNAVANPAAVNTTGIYQLVVTNTAGCRDTAMVNLNSTSTACEEKIVISPNPVTNNLFVRIVRTVAVKVELSLHNAAGQKMYAAVHQHPGGEQLYSIPMKGMGKGIYYISLYLNGKKEIIRKIVRE